MSARRSTADRPTHRWYRWGALASVAVLTGTYGSILYHVTDVVGGAETFLLVVAATLGLATVLARILPIRLATVLAVVLFGGGLAMYLLSIPKSQLALLTAGRIASDTIALLTGLSVLRLTEAGVWAMAIAPGPAFLSWYLALRGRYAWSVVAGGLALGLFVLTGDANGLTTLVGVVAAMAAVGLGTLDRQDGGSAQLDRLTIAVVGVVLVATIAPAAATGGSDPLLPDRGTTTVEASLVSADDRIPILGSIRLSPAVRFTVESPRPDYWRTASYDRYTGGGWVRTGDTGPFTGRLSGPAGPARTLEQTITPETPLDAVPAAWRPVDVGPSLAGTARVTPQGGLRSGTTLEPGEQYTVVSRVPQYTGEQLRRTGTDYPERLQTYLQLPSSTPDRVRQRAEEIAGDEETPYDKAVAIERWLEENKRYSLAVERPGGDIADSFLFEMDAGYCTYYATTMVVLLRSQGVPARFVTGYTPGEVGDDGRYVVRGLDSHAWVEVYFPDVGWIRFDPTPGDPRQSAERARLAEARQNDEPGVDTDDTETTPTPMPTESDTETPNETANAPGDARPPSFGQDSVRTPQPGLVAPEEGDTDRGIGGFLPEMPSRRSLVLAAVALVGLVAGARRTGVARWSHGTAQMWFQGRRDRPSADVERAFVRLERLLERRYRPRRRDETPRQYLDSLSHLGLDDRAHEVARTYERAHYRGTASRDEADRAIARVDALVREATPVVGRLFRRG